MPSRLVKIEHVFGGGWAPDYGSLAVVAVEQDGRCVIPWLVDSDNCEFEADGSPHKIGGITSLLAAGHTPVGSEPVRGIYDFWRQGTSGTPIQRRYMHGGSKIVMDTGDFTFSNIFTGLETDSIPHYAPFESVVIIAQTGSDMPMYSDGTTHTQFSSPTPNFSFSASHKLRMWAAGVNAAPDTLFYSAQEDPTDWTGSGSGDIAISPGDGDRITALVSHRNELFVFKGPHKGSIHRISGSAPTGDDPFAVNEFVPFGLGAVGQRSVFPFGNDIGFMWSDGSIHSLNTTDKYGDFLEVALSRPLNGWLREHINSRYLQWATAATHVNKGRVRIAIPIDSSVYNNAMLSMDYRFDPPRWSPISMISNSCYSIAMIEHSEYPQGPILAGGGTAGGLYRLDDATKSIVGILGYDATVTTPYLSYVSTPVSSMIYYGGVRLSPRNGKSFTFYWSRDGFAEQSTSGVQWTGDVLAPAGSSSTPFTLGTSTLSGDRAIGQIFDLPEGGEFQQIQYKVTNTGLANDIHLKSILCGIKPGGISMEPTA